MSITFKQARNEMLGLIHNAWLTTGFTMKWPDRKFVKPNLVPWAETILRHYPDGGQKGFGDGVKRYERIGLLTVIIYVPGGEGLSDGYDLAKVLADAIEGKSTPGGVWFRHLNIRERSTSGDYAVLSVETLFTYDEVK